VLWVRLVRRGLAPICHRPELGRLLRDRVRGAAPRRRVVTDEPRAIRHCRGRARRSGPPCRDRSQRQQSRCAL